MMRRRRNLDRSTAVGNGHPRAYRRADLLLIILLTCHNAPGNAFPCFTGTFRRGQKLSRRQRRHGRRVPALLEAPSTYLSAHDRAVEVDAIHLIRQSTSIMHLRAQLGLVDDDDDDDIQLNNIGQPKKQQRIRPGDGEGQKRGRTAVLAPPLLVEPSVAAAALKRMAQLFQRSLTETERQTGKQVLARLVQTVAVALLRQPEQVPVRAAADILVALWFMDPRPGRRPRGFENEVKARIKLAPLAGKVWERLGQDSNQVTMILSPHRLSQCLQAANTFSLPGEHPEKVDVLYDQICQRLTMGDALSRLSAMNFVNLMCMLADVGQKRRCSPVWTRSEVRLLSACCRRLRKAAVRDSATDSSLLQALDAATKILRISVLDEETVGKELRPLIYTLAQHLLRLKGRQNWDLPIPINARTMGSLCHVAGFTLALSPPDPVVDALLDNLNHTLALSDASAKDLALIVGALDKWKDWPTSNQVLLVGKRFLNLIETGSRPPSSQVNQILRAAVLLQGKNSTAMEPFLFASRRLFLENSFLEACDMLEMANFVWFAAKIGEDDDHVIAALADRICHSASTEDCAPSLAIRTLSKFTSLVTNNQPDGVVKEQHQEKLFELFRRLGGNLLTSRLTMVEISSTSRIEECNVSLAATSLWACGKMSAWESNSGPDGNHFTPAPPYLPNALTLAVFLVKNVSSLSTKDVTKALWALGRLRVDDETVVGPLMQRAALLSSQLNSQEAANILWAVSKLPIASKDLKTVFILTRRFMPGGGLSPTPQEAANVLLCFGRLNIRDEELFRTMSDVMLNQLDATSAQAVANALWAHRAVLIQPPQQLIDQWAARKLGLTPVHTIDSEWMN